MKFSHVSNLNLLRYASTAALFTLLLSVAHAQQAITLKVHHFWPPQAMPPTKILQPWCDKLAADSSNRIKCQIYPAMQLGGTPSQLFDQAKDGVVDVVFTLPGYTAGRFPVMEVFELPFMMSSAEAGSRAAWDFYEQYGKKEFSGVKPLMFAMHDNGYVHTRDKPIKTMADFKGMRMRAPTRMTNKLLAALGASPVAMPLPQLPEAVSKGVVDGFLLPWEVVPSLKLHEMVKYDSETDPARPALYSSVFILAMNPAKYESLPADLKAVIDKNSGAALSASAGATWDQSAPPARKFATDRGNTMLTIPASELDNWAKASSGLSEEWVASMDKLSLPGKQMLEDAKALLSKYKK